MRSLHYALVYFFLRLISYTGLSRWLILLRLYIALDLLAVYWLQLLPVFRGPSCQLI